MLKVSVIKPNEPHIHPIWETSQSVVDIELFNREPYWKLTTEEKKIVDEYTKLVFVKYFLEGMQLIRRLTSRSQIDKVINNLNRVHDMIRTDEAREFLDKKTKKRKHLLGK